MRFEVGSSAGEIELPPRQSLDGAPSSTIWRVPADRSTVRGYVWAQVAERLMAADCKSATHSSYGGSNPPLCTIYKDQWSGIRVQRSMTRDLK